MQRKITLYHSLCKVRVKNIRFSVYKLCQMQFENCLEETIFKLVSSENSFFWVIIFHNSKDFCCLYERKESLEMWVESKTKWTTLFTFSADILVKTVDVYCPALPWQGFVYSQRITKRKKICMEWIFLFKIFF